MPTCCHALGVGAKEAKPQPGAIKITLVMVKFQKREIRKDEVSFTAASHGLIKYLRVSSSPGVHAEMLKKLHNSGKAGIISLNYFISFGQ